MCRFIIMTIRHIALIIHNVMHILYQIHTTFNHLYLACNQCQYNSICNAYHMYYAIKCVHLYASTLLCMPQIRNKLHVHDRVPLMKNCTTYPRYIE